MLLRSDLCTVKAILRMGARENRARDTPSPLACPIMRAVLSCAHITLQAPATQARLSLKKLTNTQNKLKGFLTIFTIQSLTFLGIF